MSVGNDKALYLMGELEPDSDRRPPTAEKDAADAGFWVAASSGIFMRQWLDRPPPDDAPKRPPDARRRRRRAIGIVVLSAAVVVSLPAGFFAAYSYTQAASLRYERSRLEDACESSDTERLTRVLACIELCADRSAPHCIQKGDLYGANGDTTGAARAYQEACRLGERRGCTKASSPP